MNALVPRLVALKLSLAPMAAPNLQALNAELLALPMGPARQKLEAVVTAAAEPARAAEILAAAPMGPAELKAAAQLAARSWAAQQLVSVAPLWSKDPQKLDEAAAVWAQNLPKPAPKPIPRGSLERVRAHVFDVDDNIFLKLPTRIILFKIGAAEERAVSTEEYARIREKIGKEGEWAAYERREDSFREFRGDHFIGAVKWIVENLPESEWQGPAWKDFARLLSDPDSAKHVGILTARNHPPEVFIEAFRYLKQRGYIEHLPPVSNVFPVGDAPNHDTAGAKAQKMKEFLDRAQATPVGRKAKEVLDQDGRRKKRLHVVEFSDDDRGNFERMAHELSAELRADPARWAKVKIVLRYTGRGKRFTLVLTSRGGRRAQRVTEVRD